MAKLFHPLRLASVLALAAMPVDVTFAQTQASAEQAPTDEMAADLDTYAADEDPPIFDDPAKAVDEFKAKLAANESRRSS
ncbi:hypothetical protein [Ensifer sp. B1-9]|uniref:hypothetical protein n=1 Tax=Ensifer sp. B1-9 TaxID=3141455 RepID=UPI003D1B6EF2